MSNKVGFFGGLAIGSFDADDSFPTIDIADGAGAAVSHPNHARIRFNLSTQQIEQSINTGAWVPFATGTTAGSSLARYIVQTPDGSLPNAQALSVLGTGLVKNTTGTGVLSIAIPNTDFPALTAQYIVATATAAPPNAQNLGILTSGILQQTVSGGIATLSIKNSTALSVLGRATNSTGVPDDIQATASGQFLRRDGNNTLVFSPITTSDLPTSIQNSLNLSVANLTILAAINTTTLANEGETRFVETVKDWYHFDRNETDRTADGIEIITATGGGFWVREYILDPYWSFQSNWYIDPINGNDENEGNTLLTAIKTRSEYARRTDGTQARADIFVFITSDLLSTDTRLPHREQISIEGPGTTGFLITYTGTKIPLFTGTLTAVVNRNGPTATTTKLTIASLPVSWTASGLVGKIIEGVDGSGNPVRGVVVSDLGSKTAWISPPQFSAAFSTEGTFANGTSVTIYDGVNLSTGVSPTIQTIRYQYAEFIYCKATRWEFTGNYTQFTNCIGAITQHGPIINYINCSMTLSAQDGFSGIYGGYLNCGATLGNNIFYGAATTIDGRAFPITPAGKVYSKDKDIEFNGTTLSAALPVIRCFNSGAEVDFGGYFYGVTNGTDIIRFDTSTRSNLIQFKQIPSFGSATGINFQETSVVVPISTISTRQVDDIYNNQVIGPSGPNLNDNRSQQITHLGSGGTTLTNAANIGDIHTTVSGVIGRVANSTVLTNIVISGVEESIQFVETYKDFFHLDRHTTRTFQQDVTLSGSQPNTWWVRMNIADPYWATQTTWYIDPAGTNPQPGNDENDGLTTATPIKSIAEWRRRIKGAVFLTDVDIHALSGSTIPDDGLFYGFTTPSLLKYVRLIGVPTVLFTGTIASYVPYSGNTRGQFTDASIPTSWTASGLITSTTGSRFIRKTGTGVRHYSHLLKDLGSKSVQFGIVVDCDEAVGTSIFTSTETNFANGDAYEVVSLPTWPQAQAHSGGTILQNFDLLRLSNAGEIISAIGQLRYHLCGFIDPGQTVNSYSIRIYSSVFCNPSGFLLNGATPGLTNCSLSNGCLFQIAPGSGTWQAQRLVIVGSVVSFTDAGALTIWPAFNLHLGSLRCFDNVAPIISVGNSSKCTLSGGTIVGSGNSGKLVSCFGGSIFYGAAAITATTSDALPWRVNGVSYATPVVDLSSGDGIY